MFFRTFEYLCYNTQYMLKETWSHCCQSICSIVFKDNNGQKIASGTGFKVQNFLITNNHVYYAPGANTVELTFVQTDANTVNATKAFRYADFQARLLNGSPEANWDYAILRLDDLEFENVPSINLSNDPVPEIGHAIAVLGFQFDQSNLSIKQGVISSKFQKAGVRYLQVDASVNHGNSGGPLVDITSNQVIGIVTRKHTGLTNALDQMLLGIENNIRILAGARGGISISGVDPVQAAQISQNQMKIAALELKRSANVGIGYAYELQEILNYLNHV